MSVYFGNREIDVQDIVLLTAIAGPIGEQDGEPDAIFLKFERQTYTREQVLKLVEIIAGLQPDECGMDGGDLRLWWD